MLLRDLPAFRCPSVLKFVRPTPSIRLFWLLHVRGGIEAQIRRSSRGVRTIDLELQVGQAVLDAFERSLNRCSFRNLCASEFWTPSLELHNAILRVLVREFLPSVVVAGRAIAVHKSPKRIFILKKSEALLHVLDRFDEVIIHIEKRGFI